MAGAREVAHLTGVESRGGGYSQSRGSRDYLLPHPPSIRHTFLVRIELLFLILPLHTAGFVYEWDEWGETTMV